MKTTKKTILAVALGMGWAVLQVLAQPVPGTMSYQGRMASGGVPFSGKGLFKFVLVNADASASLWSNDGTSVGGGEPADAVSVGVEEGMFTVALGDEALEHMTIIPAGVFANAGVHLRVWFSDGESAFQQLAPDQAIHSVGYAMMAADLPDGVVTADKIAPGAIGGGQLGEGVVGTAELADGSVTTPKLADGAVTAVKLAPNSVDSTHLVNNSVTSADVADTLTLERLNLGGVTWDGSVHLFSKASGGGGGIVNPAGEARGSVLADALGAELSFLRGNGDVGVELSSRSVGGRLRLWGPLGPLAALLGTTTGGGDLRLFQIDGQPGVELDGDRSTFDHAQSSGGEVTVYTRGGQVGVLVDGDHEAAGRIEVRQAGKVQPHVDIFGSGRSGGGEIRVKDTAGNTDTVLILGAQQAETGGRIELRQADGQLTAVLDGQGGNGGGFLVLSQSDGRQSIVLDSDHSGKGRVTTDVLQITGGSDLSERFDIGSPDGLPPAEPGDVVCIDPDNPGRLVLSTRAEDPTVAGIVSGAGGVHPGMLMGQAGSEADGRHPVALTGRVYCRVDAAYGAVVPGDLLTTSDTPGHAMRVSDVGRASGAILGKAMSALPEGRGLVLVLVSLQ